MKIVLLLIGVLLLGSGAYLYSAQSSTTPQTPLVVDSGLVPEGLGSSMCTSTACMRETDQSASNTAVDTSVVAGSVESKRPAVAETSVAQVVAETIKKVIPKPPVPPPKAIDTYTEFVNPSGFVNSEPFTMADYVGKNIILVEFITYSCVNCQRTFPYMQEWHETYTQDGLLVIGIHTPEFSYERDRDNVIAAMKKEGITFPIVMDNEYATWNAYKNRFWPHRYVIDYDGNVVFDHIGEGAYAETEAVIQKLLQTKPIGV
jgi:thiol-disulfide isomerase/thioredoxin